LEHLTSSSGPVLVARPPLYLCDCDFYMASTLSYNRWSNVLKDTESKWESWGLQLWFLVPKIVHFPSNLILFAIMLQRRYLLIFKFKLHRQIK
jgi:hypothetical protein